VITACYTFGPQTYSVLRETPKRGLEKAAVDATSAESTSKVNCFILDELFTNF